MPSNSQGSARCLQSRGIRTDDRRSQQVILKGQLGRAATECPARPIGRGDSVRHDLQVSAHCPLGAVNRHGLGLSFDPAEKESAAKFMQVIINLRGSAILPRIRAEVPLDNR